MARNLRKFATLAAYQAAELIKPAVSLIEATDGVYFDQKEPPFGGLTVKYDIQDPTVEVSLFNGGGDSSSESGGGGALPATMIVDGVSETPINTWRFETAGEHIVQYTFEDNVVPQDFIKELSTVKEVVVGNNITSIGGEAILGCASLTSATIGSGVTAITNGVFYNCTALTSVTVNATTPPTFSNMAFDNTNNCPIYVPAESVNTYKAATNWSTYASRIQAIQ